DGAGWETIATVDSNSKGYVDSSAAGGSYYYRVVAENVSGSTTSSSTSLLMLINTTNGWQIFSGYSYSDRFADPDGDGIPTVFELSHLTDPSDPNSTSSPDF